jgi:hypothetical protein
MQNKLSPQQAAETKAMLMAQLDSLPEGQLPKEVNPGDVARMLNLYGSFKYLISNTEGVEILKRINYSIFCTSRGDDTGMFSEETHALTLISNFMIDNIDILKKYSED